MISTAELAALQATAADHLPDTGTITRGTGQNTALDTGTGRYDPAATTIIYDGPMRVRRLTAAAATAVRGDGAVTIARYVLTVPHDAGPFDVGTGGDVVTVTTGSDPHITGRSFRLRHPAAGSHQIDQRVELEEIDTHG